MNRNQRKRKQTTSLIEKDSPMDKFDKAMRKIIAVPKAKLKK